MAALRTALLLLSAVLLLAARADAVDGYELAGPFRITVELAHACPPHMVDVPFSTFIKLTRDRHKTSLFYFTANASISRPLDDALIGVVDVGSWNSHGGWKKNAYHFEVPFICSALKWTAPAVWRTVVTKVFNDPNRDCPFAPGDYYFNNISSSMTDGLKSVPAFIYGKYRITSIFLNTKSRERMACAVSVASVVPKYLKER